MPAILTPALALRYLRQLSTDVRAAIVLGADGRPLAGDEAIAGPAASLATLLPGGARELVVRVEAGGELRGTALVMRATVGAPTLVLAVGPLALLGLLRHDVEAVAQTLAGDGATVAEPPALVPGAVVVREASRCVQMSDGGGFPVQAAISAGMGLLDAVAAASVGSGE